MWPRPSSNLRASRAKVEGRKRAAERGGGAPASKKRHMRSVAVGAVVLLYVLHQDFWFWHEARPLVFGFLPIGLFYHAAFTVATAGVLWLLVKVAWPSHLEE